MSNSDDGGYDVGYKKPPVATRWKKGQSGNLNGRPKAPKDFATAVEEILAAPLPTAAGGTQPTDEAVLRRVALDAMKGDQRAFAHVIARAKRCGLIVPRNLDDESIGLLVPGMLTAEQEEQKFRAQEAWRAKGGAGQAAGQAARQNTSAVDAAAFKKPQEE
jgi:hypothetical protein